MRARVVAGLRTRPGAFALALASLLLIAAGAVVDGWMLTIPSHVRAACTQSSDNITYITAEGSYCMGPNPLIQPWLGLFLVALGVGLLVVAWKLDHRTLERPRQGWKALRAWGAPLLWLALVPIIAAPVGYLILGFEVREPTCEITNGWFTSSAECPVSALVPAILIPGLLNLVPLRWLWSADPRTRIAAITASALGLAALVGSLWVLFAQGPVIEVDSGFILPPLPPPGPSGLALGTVIWLLTLIALLMIAKLPLVAQSQHLTRSPARPGTGR